VSNFVNINEAVCIVTEIITRAEFSMNNVQNSKEL